MPDFKNSLLVLQHIKNQSVNAESENIDYKQIFRFTDLRDKLELIKDIVAFANTDGGFIIFGVSSRDYDWIGLDSESDIRYADDCYIEPIIKEYASCSPEYQIGKYDIDDEIYILLTIDKHIGDPITFVKDGEYQRVKPNGKQEKKHIFKNGDIYGRIKSNSCRVNDDASFLSLRVSDSSIISNLSDYPKPYKTYIERKEYLPDLLDALNNPRIGAVQINGLGGIGKTCFARNFCEMVACGNVTLNIPIKYIIWITGKLDTFLDSGDIQSIREDELTFSEILETFAKVLKIDILGKEAPEIACEVYDKLKKYNSLIVFDNMETISSEIEKNLTKLIPENCRLIFTTRNNMAVTYRRLDLAGFNDEELKSYIDVYLENFNPKNKDRISTLLAKYINDINELVVGSPLLVNMIIYSICNGGNIDVIIDNLRNMKKNSTYYDKVMEFCFSSTYSRLNMLEKRILFAMSISDINDEQFSISDLSFIVSADESDINFAIMKLHGSSFCSEIKGNYVCQKLVKVFVSKQITKDADFNVKEKISDKYYEWIKTKNILSNYESSLLNRVKAFDFARKKALLATRELKRRYEDSIVGYEDTIVEVDKLIAEQPSYGYLYFFRAEIQKNEDSVSILQIREDYEKAIKCDKDNDFYYAEYAYYLSKIKDNGEAIKYFEKALQIKDNHNYHFGIAVAMVKFYNNKPEYKEKTPIILEHFNKAYFENDDRANCFRNGRTADAHARYLKSLGRLEEALEICEKGIVFTPYDSKLKALQGTIMKQLNPNYVSNTTLRSIKTGLFGSIDDDVAKRIAEIYLDSD